MVIYGSGDIKGQSVNVTNTVISGGMGIYGPTASYSVADRSTSGAAAFYRDGGVNRLWDSTYGNVITYTSSGITTLVNGALSLVFNCTSTGATNCMQQVSGTFVISGAGNAAFQSLALTNGPTVDARAPQVKSVPQNAPL